MVIEDGVRKITQLWATCTWALMMVVAPRSCSSVILREEKRASSFSNDLCDQIWLVMPEQYSMDANSFEEEDKGGRRNSQRI